MPWRRHILPKGLPLALAGSIASLVWLFAATPQQQNRAHPNAKPAEDYFGEHVRIREYDNQGQLAQLIASPSVRHLSNGDQLLLDAPTATLFIDGKPGWTLKAGSGRMNEGGENLWLENEVQATKLADSSTLRTHSLRVEPQRKYAETDDAVMISAPQGTTESQGMRAFLDRDTVQLKSRVKGRYEAQ